MLTLLRTQTLIEQNEDIMACIVENMQLGRIDDCIQQFPLLLNQLIGLSLEFDNYPVMGDEEEEEEENDNFKNTASHQFPDRFMRKDVLDDIRQINDFYIPPSPPIPICLECHQNKNSSYSCRTINSHIQPNYKLTPKEHSEFLHATEILAKNHSVYNMEKIKNKNMKKKVYQKWTTSDKCTVMLAIATKKSTKASQIKKYFKGRSITQLRSYINKNFTVEQLSDLKRGIIPQPPPKYQPPASLLNDINAGQSMHDLESGRGIKINYSSNNNNNDSQTYSNAIHSIDKTLDDDDDDDMNNKKQTAYLGTSLIGPISCGAPGSWNDMLRIAATPPSTNIPLERVFSNNGDNVGISSSSSSYSSNHSNINRSNNSSNNNSNNNNNSSSSNNSNNNNSNNISNLISSGSYPNNAYYNPSLSSSTSSVAHHHHDVSSAAALQPTTAFPSIPFHQHYNRADNNRGNMKTFLNPNNRCGGTSTNSRDDVNNDDDDEEEVDDDDDDSSSIHSQSYMMMM